MAESSFSDRVLNRLRPHAFKVSHLVPGGEKLWHPISVDYARAVSPLGPRTETTRLLSERYCSASGEQSAEKFIARVYEAADGIAVDRDMIGRNHPNFRFLKFPGRGMQGTTHDQTCLITSPEDILEALAIMDPLHKTTLLDTMLTTLRKNVRFAALSMQPKDVTVFRFGNPRAPFPYGGYALREGPNSVAYHADFQPRGGVTWWHVLTPNNTYLTANEYERPEEHSPKKLYVEKLRNLERHHIIIPDDLDDDAIVAFEKS